MTPRIANAIDETLMTEWNVHWGQWNKRYVWEYLREQYGHLPVYLTHARRAGCCPTCEEFQQSNGLGDSMSLGLLLDYAFGLPDCKVTTQYLYELFYWEPETQTRKRFNRWTQNYRLYILRVVGLRIFQEWCRKQGLKLSPRNTWELYGALQAFRQSVEWAASEWSMGV